MSYNVWNWSMVPVGKEAVEIIIAKVDCWSCGVPIGQQCFHNWDKGDTWVHRVRLEALTSAMVRRLEGR